METKFSKDFSIEIAFTTRTDTYALFDPYNLERFCLTHNITTDNLEYFFSEHEEMAKLSQKTGVIIPAYPYTKNPDDAPELTYRMIVSGKRAIKKVYQKFIVRDMSLEIIGGKLAISDMSVLQAWRADYYKNLSQGAPLYYLLDIESGLYNVNSIGFNCGENNYGYNFVLRRKLAE